MKVSHLVAKAIGPALLLACLLCIHCIEAAGEQTEQWTWGGEVRGERESEGSKPAPRILLHTCCRRGMLGVRASS